MIDKLIKDKNLLWFAILVSMVTYMGWSPIKDYFQVQIFYKGIGVFIFLLSVYIWRISHRHSVPEFVLFCLALNNLLDELVFDPTTFEANEVVFLIIVVVYSIKLKK